jgi:murein DD-endopeptidase MepM/ murein hydrolase activator NlpD
MQVKEKPSIKLTVEQMRRAGERAAEKEKRETQLEQASSAVVPRAQGKPETLVVRPLDRQVQEQESNPAQPVIFRGETAFTRLADGFDFPVGKPDAQGYYKARGFRSHGHLGEDWDGIRGGDTDLGDPIYSIGDGVVVFARDCHMGWGNVIIVRHSYREGGTIKNIDALYGHLNGMLVRRGQAVTRGQRIGTMGSAHGLYDAHLHLEIRKNIEIGMSRAAFARDFSNYYDPSQFIASHRHLQTSGGTYRVAMNTFVRDAAINFDKARNYSQSHYRGGSSESAAALKKAVASRQ